MVPSANLRTIPVACRAATTANITSFTTPPTTIDDVVLVNNDVVLVKDQTITTENGFYVVNDGGSWTKIMAHAFSGMVASVTEGTLYSGLLFLMIINGSNITFTNMSTAAISAAEAYIDASSTIVHTAGTETITGSKDFTGGLTKSGTDVALDTAVVHLAGAETITGNKTLSGTLTANGNSTFTAGADFTAATVTGLPLDADVVHKTGDETISGIKNFTGSLKSAGVVVAQDTTVAHLAGSETITGAKNFTGGLTINSVNAADTNVTDALSGRLDKLQNKLNINVTGNWQIATVTYSDMTGVSGTYTKYGSSTQSDLLVIMEVGCYRSWSTGGANTAYFGVSINGTDYTVAWTVLYTQWHHVSVGGTLIVSDQNAFTSQTVKGRALSDRTTSDVKSDSNDSVTLFVVEIPK